jgi:hypothetical protein
MRLRPALPRSGPSWRPSSALTQHTSSCTTAASQTPQAALSRCPRLRARRRGLRRSRPRGRPWQLRGCRSHRCRRLQSRRPRLVQRHLGSHLRLWGGLRCCRWRRDRRLHLSRVFQRWPLTRNLAWLFCGRVHVPYLLLTKFPDVPVPGGKLYRVPGVAFEQNPLQMHSSHCLSYLPCSFGCALGGKLLTISEHNSYYTELYTVLYMNGP